MKTKKNFPKIIFIAGFSRSGSTLLDRLLSQTGNFFSGGELRYIWERNIVQNQLCSCGKKFNYCEIWNEILNDAFGYMTVSKAKQIKRLFNSLHSKKNLIFIINEKFRTKEFTRQLNEWGDIVNKLYFSISKISGKNYIIDSSKTPTYGILLKDVLKKDNIFTIHLIRDPRAVAFSRLRKKIRLEIHWEKKFMKITPTAKTALDWSICNILCNNLTNKTESMIVKYEKLVENPETNIKQIYNNIKNENITNYNYEKCYINLESNHSTSGNPMRFLVGKIKIKNDDEWKSKMDRNEKNKISLISYPILKKYCYKYHV